MALPDSAPEIDVVVVNYNTRQHLRACLRTLRGQASRVVVADNGSTDGSQEMVRREYPEVVVLEDGVNRGYGAAANLGIRSGRARHVLVLNSDTLIPAGGVAALSRYLDHHPDVAVVGPRLLNPDGSLQRSCFPFPTPLTAFLGETGLGFFIRFIPGLRERYPRTWRHDRPRTVPWVLGAALAIRRAAFDAVGGFDERFFMYFEEVDLAYRLGENGWNVDFAPVTEVVHVGKASTRQSAHRMRLEYYASMSRFYEHHYPWRRRILLRLVVRSKALIVLLRDILWLAVGRSSRREGRAAAVATQARLVSGKWRGGLDDA